MLQASTWLLDSTGLHGFSLSKLADLDSVSWKKRMLLLLTCYLTNLAPSSTSSSLYMSICLDYHPYVQFLSLGYGVLPSIW